MEFYLFFFVHLTFTCFLTLPYLKCIYLTCIISSPSEMDTTPSFNANANGEQPTPHTLFPSLCESQRFEMEKFLLDLIKENKKMETCPLCRAEEVIPLIGVSNYVCQKCRDKATNNEGHKVIFVESPTYKILCYNTITHETTHFDEPVKCLIDGTECEAHLYIFGGVVITTKSCV